MPHRSLLFNVSVLAIVVSLISMIALVLDAPWLPYVQVLQFGLLFMLVAVLITTRMAAHRAKKQLEATPRSRYALVGRDLLMYERDLAMHGSDLHVGEEILSKQVDLDAVRFISWWASPKLKALRDEFIVLWDRDPKIVLTELEPTASDPDAQLLAMVSLVDLAKQTEVHSAFTYILTERQLGGEVDANVDFVTGRMLPDRMPELAPGTSPRSVRGLTGNR